jgi:hypothetical protein
MIDRYGPGMARSRQSSPIPSFDQLMMPTVQALRLLGGSASIEELNQKVIEVLGLPEEIASYRRAGASENEVLYRAAWARTYLRRDGILERAIIPDLTWGGDHPIDGSDRPARRYQYVFSSSGSRARARRHWMKFQSLPSTGTNWACSGTCMRPK